MVLRYCIAIFEELKCHINALRPNIEALNDHTSTVERSIIPEVNNDHRKLKFHGLR